MPAFDKLADKIEEARELRNDSFRNGRSLWEATLATAFRPDCGQSGPPASSGIETLQLQAEHYANHTSGKHNNAHVSRPVTKSEGLYPVPDWVWTTLGSVLTHLVDCVNDTPDFSDEPTGKVGLKSTNVRPYLLDMSQRWYMTSGCPIRLRTRRKYWV